MAAEEILAEWMGRRDRLPLDRIVQTELRSRRQLNSSERRWIGDAVFGSVRYWRRQTWLLERVSADTGPRARIELWADQSDSGGAGERIADTRLPGPELPMEYLRKTLSFSDEMAEALEDTLGSDAVAAGLAFNGQAPTTLRVNTLRTSRESAMRHVPGSAPTRFSPWGLHLPGRVNVYDLPGFREGWFELQEEASQLTALLADARPGQTIVEVGAGAGGKSLVLAAMMQNSGSLLSLDISSERLDQLSKRAARAGARIIRPLLLDADDEGRWQLSGEGERTVGRLRGTADCVLLDAPCSGSGAMRRAPDVKWRADDLSSFSSLQALLLEQSAGFVGPEGCLIYATCAFEPEQNEAVIERFLGSEAGKPFEPVDALKRLEGVLQRPEVHAERRGPEAHNPARDLDTMRAGPFLRTWPHLHDLDAFFAACLVRRHNEPDR